MSEEPVHLPPEAMSSWILTPASRDEGRVAKHDLAAATRALIGAIAVLNASSPGVSAIAAEVAALAARVEALPRLAGGAGGSGGDDARLLERSGISGMSNPLSPPMHLELDGDVVRGWAEYGWQYEGPPGCVHGGFVAAAFDDLLGTAQTLSGTAGFTGTLTIRMERPTPINHRIDYEGGVTSLEGRKITAWGRACADGAVVASAVGVFITPRRLAS